MLFQVKYLGKSECEATWEPSDCLPTKIIEAFKRRIETVVVAVSRKYSGQISSTLKLSEGDEYREPPEKKSKRAKGEIPDEG